MAGESSTNPPNAPASHSGSTDKPRKSLDTVFQGIKRAFSLKKKPKASKGTPVETAPPVPALPLPATSEETAPAPATATVAPTPKPEASSKTEPRKHRQPPGPPPPVKSAAERREELFKKHGLEFTPSLFPPHSDKPPAKRVHKEIRMRVHRTCHKCTTSFGADKTCVNCQHKRCKLCPRFPSKKDKKDKGKEKEKHGDKREVKPIGRRRKEPLLTLPSRTGGQDLVRKKIRQRVHRTCHRCKTDFGAEKVCSNCKHNRCKKCPRDPYKTNKPPGYYDGRDSSDSESEPIGRRPLRTFKKIRQRVHWTCSKCSATFEQGCKICEGCGSRREVTGVRDPSKKGKKKEGLPSDSYMDNLEERLMATSIAWSRPPRTWNKCIDWHSFFFYFILFFFCFLFIVPFFYFYFDELLFRRFI